MLPSANVVVVDRGQARAGTIIIMAEGTFWCLKRGMEERGRGEGGGGAGGSI